MSGASSTNERLRVLFFDYWLSGIHNFKRIVDATDPREASFLLLHLSSLRGRSVPSLEIVEDILCVDIRVFGRSSLDRILESLRPHVVLGLNMFTLFDRAMFLTCARLNIPTVYLQHGFLLENDAFLDSCKDTDQTWRIRDYLARVPKYSHLVPWYMRARRRALSDPVFWKVLWSLAASPAVASHYPLAPQELWPTLALVYSQNDSDRLMQNYSLAPERIGVVGNPELDAALVRARQPLNAEQRADLVRSIGLDPAVPVVFYADEGLAEAATFGWTRGGWADRMTELYSCCQDAGVQLLFRPRRVETTTADLGWNGKKGVATTRAVTIVDSVDLSAVVVGTITTVLQTAVILGKPILVPVWYFGGRGRETHSPYLKYRAGIPVQSPELLRDVISRAVAGELRIDTAEFAARHLGPCDGSASSRIARAILDLAARGRTESGCPSPCHGSH